MGSAPLYALAGNRCVNLTGTHAARGLKGVCFRSGIAHFREVTKKVSEKDEIAMKTAIHRDVTADVRGEAEMSRMAF